MEWTNDARVVRVWCGLKAAVLVRMNGKMERSQNLIKGICRTFQHIEKILTLCGNILHKYIHVHVFTIKYLPHIAIDILISKPSAAAWRRQVCGQWSARHVTRDTAWRRCCTWPLAVTQLVQWCATWRHTAAHRHTDTDPLSPTLQPDNMLWEHVAYLPAYAQCANLNDQASDI